MSNAPRLHRYTFQDYLALEEGSTVRHEFLSGEIYAMAGGTPKHAALAMAVGATLVDACRGRPCRVHSLDLRIKVPDTGLVTYPDVTVVCRDYETDPENENTVTNPLIVVEVTSDSTEEYDRGEKLDNYRRIKGLSAVVLISHREQLIELFERGAQGWQRTQARRGGNVELSALPARLDVDAIYGAATAS